MSYTCSMCGTKNPLNHAGNCPVAKDLREVDDEELDAAAAIFERGIGKPTILTVLYTITLDAGDNEEPGHINFYKDRIAITPPSNPLLDDEDEPRTTILMEDDITRLVATWNKVLQDTGRSPADNYGAH